MQKNKYPIFIREIIAEINFFLDKKEYKIALFYYIDLFTCIKNYIYTISLSLSDKNILSFNKKINLLEKIFDISIDRNELIKLDKFLKKVSKYHDKNNIFFEKKDIIVKVKNDIEKLISSISKILEIDILLTIRTNKITNNLSYILINDKIKIKNINNLNNLADRSFYIKLNKKYFLLKIEENINKYYYPDKREDIIGKLYNNFLELLLEGNPFYLKKNIIVERKIKTIDKKDNYIDENIYIGLNEVNNSVKDLLKKNGGFLIINGAMGIGKTTFINNLKFQNIEIKILEINNSTNYKQIEDFMKNLSKIKTKTLYIFDNIEKIENLSDFISKINLINDAYFIFTTLNLECIEISKFTKNLDYINMPYLSISNLKLLIYKIAKEKILLFDIETYSKILSNSNGIIYYAKILINEILGNKKYVEKEKKILEEDLRLLFSYSDESYLRLFISILIVNKEGLHISEIQQLLDNIDISKIESFIKLFKYYIIKINGRYKISSSVIIGILKEIIDITLIRLAHSKMIDFYEPWDKKVYSNTLKYLPYHYLQVNEIDKLKKLLESNFSKSKLKIYPFELLEDIRSIIKYYKENNKENISDIINFSFIYQDLKSKIKKEILSLETYIKNKEFSKINKLIASLDLPHNKIYFILVVAILSYEDNSLEYSKNIFKNISIIDEKVNKELLFKLVAYIASKGFLDIISFPKNMQEALLFIKNIKELGYSEQLLTLILKISNNIFSEMERGILIEQLILKVSEFKDIDFIEKFFIKILEKIDNIKDKSVKNSLYYTHIMAVMKFPELYSKFLPILIDIKNKL